jgi:metal-responsive CopG/Arc/MetJ family transcriptional regulator
MSFDTHVAFEGIAQAKDERERAEAILRAIKAATATDDNAATKQDIATMAAITKQEISGMKSELQALFHSEMLTQTRWLVTTVIAVAVVALTLSHFIH